MAWGFTLYLAVNIIDVLYGFIPNFKFLPDNILGDMYRFFVDLFSVLVLIGVFYFLLRRFLFNDNRLISREPVMLSDKAKRGMFFDSLLVGSFIIVHIGSRFLSASFEITLSGADWSQPAANLVSNLWTDIPTGKVKTLEHITWWLALGLILAFLPYFPYSKHAHLFMGPLNIMVTKERSSMATLGAINFEDDEINQFGASQILHLAQSQLLDGYACIQCSRCQDACPAYVTGKELSPSALEINKRYFLNQNMKAISDGEIIEKQLTDWMLTEEAAWSCTTWLLC